MGLPYKDRRTTQEQGRPTQNVGLPKCGAVLHKAQGCPIKNMGLPYKSHKERGTVKNTERKTAPKNMGLPCATRRTAPLKLDGIFKNGAVAQLGER